MATFFTIEGVHGVGKSTVVEELKKLGFPIVTENFIKLKKECKFPLQTLTTRMYWISTRIRNMTMMSEDPIVFTDRSVYSAAIYSNNLKDMRILYKSGKRMRGELVELGNRIFTIFLWIDKTTGLERVSNRLTQKKKGTKLRRVLKEGSRKHYEEIWEKYANFKWDHSIRTTGKTPLEIAMEIIGVVGLYDIESTDSDDSPMPIKITRLSTEK